MERVGGMILAYMRKLYVPYVTLPACTKFVTIQSQLVHLDYMLGKPKASDVLQQYHYCLHVPINVEESHIVYMSVGSVLSTPSGLV